MQIKEQKMNKFRKELETLINKHSMENGSNTPDFILAEYLESCLKAFDLALSKRASWRISELETTPNINQK